ncbi:SH3 domain-containing protein [Symbiobacterium terraclitae]|uniref:SH3 domain-containing protein n=1 Tax=Symbiobacterium terraclitae TaxID=557451 RepID=UPI0035B55D4C
MKRTVAAALLLVCMSATAEAATLRPIDQDGLNVRSGPGTEYDIVGGLGYDQEAVILGREGDWYRIMLSSGQEGWVAGWFSRVLLEDEVRYAIVDTDILNVRREPALDAPVISRIYQDQYVRLLEMIPEWWRIQLADGTEGWVFAQYVRQATAPPAPGTAPDPGTVPDPGAAPDPGTTPGPSVPVYTEAPAAPPGTVPDIAFAPPRAPTARPGTVAHVTAETGIYAGPNSEARRMDTVRPGDPLQLLDASGGWVRVASPQGRWGWVPGSQVAITDGELRIALGESGWSIERPAPRPAGTPAPTDGDAEVREGGATVYLIPAVSARLVAELEAGEPLTVLEHDSGWVKVRMESGQVGWTRASFLRAVVAEEEQAPDAAPASRGFKVAMSQSAPGVSRLELAAPGATFGQPVLQDGRLLIPFATGVAGERSVPVGNLGVASAAIGPEGLRIDLVGEPQVTVESHLEGSLLISLRPVLSGIRQETVADKGVVRFSLSGATRPEARAEDGQIIVEIPGAVLGTDAVPAGLHVVQHATGVRVVVPSNQPYALKASSDGYYLVTYPPGLAGKVIMLDPGHGGDDGGAVSRSVGVVEKAVNLQVALRLRALLAERGAIVYMTRATDQRVAPETFLNAVDGEPRDQLDLQYRTMLANALGVDLFLSLHHNSGETLSQGTEVYYTSATLNGGRSRELAHLLQQELVGALGTRNRGVFDDTFFVTRNTLAPSALVELAFINNPAEGPRTVDPAFQEAAARAIVWALEQFYAAR